MLRMSPMLLSTSLVTLRPQDVFATVLYTGTGMNQKISTPFAPDFAWGKTRSAANSHILLDRLRGANQALSSNTRAIELAASAGNEFGISFDADGLTLGPNGTINGLSDSEAIWPIKRAAKFFDIVIYTGDGTSGRQFPHGLGIAPGMIIVKRRDVAQNWLVYSRNLGAGKYLLLSTTDSAYTDNSVWGGVEPTSAAFTVSTNTNVSGASYVAYLFAHDPDPNGIIQCGRFTGGNITLGWQPQWIIIKNTVNPEDWIMFDATRGWTNASVPNLRPNTSAAETTNNWFTTPSATGLTSALPSDYIYAVIRAPII